MTNRDLIDKANTLRWNGQNNLAEKIYDQLLALQPNNDEVIFCKALNIKDNNPKLAISLFKKSVEINPNIFEAAFDNINIIVNINRSYTLGIEAYNDLLKIYPDNLDIIYNRAVNISNSGDYLNALLDFYYVVDNSTISNNSNEILESQILIDIEFCKKKLRAETLLSRTPNIQNGERLYSVKMKEYQYLLPSKLIGDENYHIDFSEMAGWTIEEIIQTQPNYIRWWILNIDNFCVGEEIIELAKQQGVNMLLCEKVNLFKLKILERQKKTISTPNDISEPTNNSTMITENQKLLIFDINCYYQLASQKNKLATRQPIIILPELSMLSTLARSDGELIDWSKIHKQLYRALTYHGLSEDWINELQTQLDFHLNTGGAIETFREEFLTSIELLTNMVMSIYSNFTIPHTTIAENVFVEIFEKDYWEGPVIEAINIVRSLSTELGFSRHFIVEFLKIFVGKK